MEVGLSGKKAPKSSSEVVAGKEFFYEQIDPQKPQVRTQIGVEVIERLYGHGGVVICLVNLPQLSGKHVHLFKMVFGAEMQGVAQTLLERERQISAALFSDPRDTCPFVAKNYGIIAIASDPQNPQRSIYALHNKWYPLGNLSQGLGTLGTRSYRDFVPEEEFKTYMKSALEGLMFIHRKGVTHRDIKPENILVDGCFSVLTDFGSSKIVLSGAGNMTFVNTKIYAAPEQLNLKNAGDNQVQAAFTNACDIWSLGLTFYQLLTSVLPDHFNNQYRQNGQIRFPKEPVISPQLRQTLQNMIQLNPNNRPSAADLLRTDYFMRITYPTS